MKLKAYASILCLLAAWQYVSQAGYLPQVIAPSPWRILLGLKALAISGMPPGKLLWPHLIHSLVRVGVGFGTALICGVSIGLMVGGSQKMRHLFCVPLEFMRPIPPLAWIPISIYWFGISTTAAAFIIFLGAFFPILVNTAEGVACVDKTLIAAARTLNAGRLTLFFKVLVPATVPAIFTGMRIGIGVAWMTLIAAEFSGVKQGYGLGFMIMTARDIQRPDLIMAGMLVIGLTGFVIDAGMRRLQKYCVCWQ